MYRNDIELIENVIGYKFNNVYLLVQAFTRRSFSQENGGLDNEILEFVGDKVLDYFVVKILVNNYACILKNREYKGLYSDFSEGDLTNIKKKLVEKKMLAHRIDLLGLNHFLIMGKRDIYNNVQYDTSVMEDLFEAILGAVAIDSKWDEKSINNVINKMLEPMKYLGEYNNDNYIDLIQTWHQRKYNELPLYEFYFDNNNHCYVVRLFLRGIKKFFSSLGRTKTEARMNAAREALEYLEKNNLFYSKKDIVGEASLDRAINQLQELHQKGYISKPIYEDYLRGYDVNGNPVWDCDCTVEEYGSCKVTSQSKKIAKKHAAYEMIKVVLNNN